jgi:hypothetical protein
MYYYFRVNMMVENKFNIETTVAGQQFVIPGTEKPINIPRKRYAKDGQQLVIPGAEQIKPKEFLARLSEKPIRPRVVQRSLAGTSLFSKHNNNKT